MVFAPVYALILFPRATIVFKVKMGHGEAPDMYPNKIHFKRPFRVRTLFVKQFIEFENYFYLLLRDKRSTTAVFAFLFPIVFKNEEAS